MTTKASVERPPHSWGQGNWPPAVYPGDSARGKYVCRAHRTELTQVGALVRIGREIVVMGGPYAAWLARQSKRVEGFSIAPNSPTRGAPVPETGSESERSVHEGVEIPDVSTESSNDNAAKLHCCTRAT